MYYMICDDHTPVSVVPYLYILHIFKSLTFPGDSNETISACICFVFCFVWALSTLYTIYSISGVLIIRKFHVLISRLIKEAAPPPLPTPFRMTLHMM